VTVRSSVLALLRQGPRYGARIKADFEQATGGAWTLNVGQVYTTLGRLERDGLVAGETRAPAPDRGARTTRGTVSPASPDRPDSGDVTVTYRLTEQGAAEADGWWTTPVDRETPARDELVIKLALAISTPGVDPYAVITTQRTATMRHLRELTRRKLALDPTTPGGTAPSTSADRLVLEHQLFTVEAELRWLDHVEAVLSHAPRERKHDEHPDT